MGKELSDAGFNELYGLDSSPAMLAKAVLKNVYHKVYKTVLGKDEMPAELYWDEKLPKNSGMDLVVCSDGMIEGHLPETICDDVVKILRPGGHFAFTIRDSDSQKYLQTLEKHV